MPIYLDAGVQRIQQYLARTPALRLRRGASWMISNSTSPGAIQQWISACNLDGVQATPDAGHADGVVSLIVPDGKAEQIAQLLLLHLRTQLPAADLHATWADAPDYVTAVAAMKGASHPGMMALAPVTDFALAATCPDCRADAAVADGRCADCDTRDGAAGRRGLMTRPATMPAAGGQTAAPANNATGAELRLLHQINIGRPQLLRPVQTMDELAQLGESDGNRNHVATIAIDGNAVGAFFDTLISRGETDAKQQMSIILSDATRAALLQAVTKIVHEGDQLLPAIVHIVGGDDVVVSVPADRAWHFTTTLLDSFRASLTAATARLTAPVLAALPTTSAGIVFAKSAFPYARAVSLAETTLRTAKSSTRQAAIGWLDVTEDGEHLPAWRQPIAVARHHDLAGHLTALRALPSTGRATLARLLATYTGPEAVAAAGIWARRNGHTAVTSLLQQIPAAEARNVVAMTRWWR